MTDALPHVDFLRFTIYAGVALEVSISLNVSVIGNGRWGSFLAWYLAQQRHDVLLYGRAESKRTQRLCATRQNDLLTLPDDVRLTSSLGDALGRDVVLISVPSQALRSLCRSIAAAGGGRQLFVLCMKGLEVGSGKRLSEVLHEELPEARVAVWLGPGHVQEFVGGTPNCMVIDAVHSADRDYLVDELSSDLIRFYYGADLIGNEIGAAAKNVIGIAAGMLDGFGLSSLKGALMSRGTREVARLCVALGGQELSAYGLCHLGDYEATVFSRHSHNRMFGERFIRGEEYHELAEGYYTVQALVALEEKSGIELPISRGVYDMLYNGAAPDEVLRTLFTRSQKQEFA